MPFRPLPRRTFLRGAGAALALPLLDSMAPLPLRAQSTEAKSGSPVRLGVLYMPNGADMTGWAPPGNGGPLTTLSPILEPLAKVKSEVLVLTELWNRAAEPGYDGHYVKLCSLLTGSSIEKSTSALNSNGISMDQLAAQRIGHLTPLPSLELSLEPVRTGVDSTVMVSEAYGAYLSWASPTTPVPREISPRIAFQRLFQGGTRNVSEDKSVLDTVLSDARAVRSRVGVSDQRTLDQFLDSVRAVETRIQNEARAAARQQATLRSARRGVIEELGKRAAAIPDEGRGRFRDADPTERTRLMIDLMVLAFWTDSTRIATFMFGNAVSGRNFSFLPGVNNSFHELSHHGKDPGKMAQYRKINTWHVAQYAYLLEKLQAIKEGGKTLLDNSMILFASGLADGNDHNPHNLPLVLGGRGGGTISPGRHLVYPKDSPLCNLHVSMLNRLGVPTTSFADSTGELSGLAG